MIKKTNNKLWHYKYMFVIVTI